MAGAKKWPAGKMKLLFRIVLEPRHRQTGKTHHYGGLGQDRTLMPPAHELRIGHYEGSEGYYLLYIDGSGSELTDTYHDTIEKAMEQAELEYQVKLQDWEKV